MTTQALCAVCSKNPSIGICCTFIPYSCNYCADCARRFAQPLHVFEAIRDHDVDVDPDMLDFLGKLETFVDGQFVNYNDWIKKYPASLQ